MAEHAPVVAGAPLAAHDEHHPSAAIYVRIFVVLFVLTAAEVSTVYLPEWSHNPALHPIVPPLLILLAGLKFGLVVAFYMHLRFDSWLFTALFVGGLLIAISIAVALMTMFGTWWQVPLVGPGGEHGG
jgi:cytochrome c oxidase subunit 4